MDFPEVFKQHTIAVEAVSGHDGYGRPTFAPSADVRCLVEETRRQVRNDQGDTTLSEATVLAPLDSVAPPESRILLPSGRLATVISTRRIDGGSLPVPSHLVIYTT